MNLSSGFVGDLWACKETSAIYAAERIRHNRKTQGKPEILPRRSEKRMEAFELVVGEQRTRNYAAGVASTIERGTSWSCSVWKIRQRNGKCRLQQYCTALCCTWYSSIDGVVHFQVGAEGHSSCVRERCMSATAICHQRKSLFRSGFHHDE